TTYPSLFLLTRGKALPQPSEHLLRDSTDQFFKEIYHQYDYIIIDSSPVLATDDTTSLSPKIDATLLVVRLSHTSARLTKKALELLYSRQVNIPGIILMSILHCRSITTSNIPNTTTDHSLLQNLKQPRSTEPDKPSLLELRF